MHPVKKSDDVMKVHVAELRDDRKEDKKEDKKDKGDKGGDKKPGLFGGSIYDGLSIAPPATHANLTVSQFCASAFDLLMRETGREGLFRTAANSAEIAATKALLNDGKPLPAGADVELVADLLKTYFRELKPRLIPEHCALRLLAIAEDVQLADDKRKTILIKQMKAQWRFLPMANWHLLQLLMFLLHKVKVDQAKQQQTAKKLDAGGLAIVWAPNLFAIPPKESFERTKKENNCIKLMIEHYSILFDQLPAVRPVTPEGSFDVTVAELQNILEYEGGWVVNGAKAANDQKQTFKLQWILQRWHLVKDDLLNNPSSSSKSTHAALTLLKDLYMLDVPGWRGSRDKVEVGIVSSTDDCGDTSLSAGLAALCFGNPAWAHQGPMCTICTFGPKNFSCRLYAYFTKQPTVNQITALAECNIELSISISAASLKKGTPQNSALIKAIRDAFQTSPAPIMMGADSFGISVFSFFTAELRNKLEVDAKSGDVDKDITTFFEEFKLADGKSRIFPVSLLLDPDAPPRHTLRQAEEGQLGLLAAARMYQQMHGGGVTAVAALRIGAVSSQFSLFKHEALINEGMTPSAIHSFGFKYGSNAQAQDLVWLGRAITDQMIQARPESPESIYSFVRLLLDAPRPLIALRSSCLNALDKNETNRRTLLSDPFVKKGVQQKLAGVFFGSKGPEMVLCAIPSDPSVVYKIPMEEGTTVSSLCAKVAEKVAEKAKQKSSTYHFLQVVRQGADKPVTDSDLSRVGTKTLLFQPFGEGGAASAAVPERKQQQQDLSFEDVRREIIDQGGRWEPNYGVSPEPHAVPLSWIVDKWQLFRDSYVEDKLKNTTTGKVRGGHAALTTLKALWYLDNPKWREIRDKVQIGLVKETEDCGNSSVSMGMASYYFSTTRSACRLVVFLNCGTGGVKYQLYCQRNTSKGPVVALVAEFKPRGLSFSNLEFPHVEPKFEFIKINLTKFKEKTQPESVFVRLKKQISAELREAPWVNGLKKWRDPQSNAVPIYAFITGKVRNHYEDDRVAEKHKVLMDQRVAAVFNDLGVPVHAGNSLFAGDNKSYFISQEREGQMELLGCTAMYKQLGVGAEPIVSFGIGEGTTQWCMLDPRSTKWESYHTTGVSKGMRANLDHLGIEILMQLSAGPEMAKLLTNAENKPKPVIALKSGCLLLIDDPTLEYQLKIRDPPQPGRRAVSLRVSDLARKDVVKELRVLAPVSMSRLCAEAAIALFSASSASSASATPSKDFTPAVLAAVAASPKNFLRVWHRSDLGSEVKNDAFLAVDLEGADLLFSEFAAPVIDLTKMAPMQSSTDPKRDFVRLVRRALEDNNVQNTIPFLGYSWDVILSTEYNGEPLAAHATAMVRERIAQRVRLFLEGELFLVPSNLDQLRDNLEQLVRAAYHDDLREIITQAFFQSVWVYWAATVRNARTSEHWDVEQLNRLVATSFELQNRLREVVPTCILCLGEKDKNLHCGHFACHKCMQVVSATQFGNEPEPTSFLSGTPCPMKFCPIDTELFF